MTDKEHKIINFLIDQSGQAFYLDIRENLGYQFENETDFDKTLQLLTLKNWIYETDFGSTLYKINEQMTKTENFVV